MDISEKIELTGKIMDQVTELEKKIQKLQEQKAYHMRRYARVVDS